MTVSLRDAQAVLAKTAPLARNERSGGFTAKRSPQEPLLPGQRACCRWFANGPPHVRPAPSVVVGVASCRAQVAASPAWAAPGRWSFAPPAPTLAAGHTHGGAGRTHA